ncbi:hypothetical protein [Streptomyces sp. SID1034]|uniref:hypothetical protein n=1 Tax=Streptomyces sp. SID1034 TaxID=2690248 RepID=UPI0013710F7B|nr:hypothetical protein [Streptomyces sp. SID1034]MYV96371.1 hypothetical protein [Streptomyces sp. SID1034]
MREGEAEYRCSVRAELRIEGHGTAMLINSYGTPSAVLAASWLRGQAAWCVGKLGDDDASGRRLAAWLRDETAQWRLFAALMAGESVPVRVHEGGTFVLLHARRVDTPSGRTRRGRTVR